MNKKKIEKIKRDKTNAKKSGTKIKQKKRH